MADVILCDQQTNHWTWLMIIHGSSWFVCSDFVTITALPRREWCIPAVPRVRSCTFADKHATRVHKYPANSPSFIQKSQNTHTPTHLLGVDDHVLVVGQHYYIMWLKLADNSWHVVAVSQTSHYTTCAGLSNCCSAPHRSCRINAQTLQPYKAI